MAFVVFENILRYSPGTERDDFAAAEAADPTEVFSEILREASFFKHVQVVFFSSDQTKAN